MIAYLQGRETLDLALGAERAVVYKHSPICWQSVLASRQVKRFSEEHAEVPVYWLDVVAYPDVAQVVAGCVGIGHASPQVILLSRGRAEWSASHFGVKATALGNAIDQGGSA